MLLLLACLGIFLDTAGQSISSSNSYLLTLFFPNLVGIASPAELAGIGRWRSWSPKLSIFLFSTEGYLPCNQRERLDFASKLDAWRSLWRLLERRQMWSKSITNRTIVLHSSSSSFLRLSQFCPLPPSWLKFLNQEVTTQSSGRNYSRKHQRPDTSSPFVLSFYFRWIDWIFFLMLWLEPGTWWETTFQAPCPPQSAVSRLSHSCMSFVCLSLFFSLPDTRR